MFEICNTPVLFLIFNRPNTTEQVFEAIAKAKPRCLFVAADGPRTDKEGEAEKCQAVRDIIKRVDWDCEVKTLFREQNLGCKEAVSSAITWFFEQVEEGIILEDDCLPSDSFFSFCAELLEKYRDDKRIMMISGDNFQDGIQRGDASYYFSSVPWIWGWATWRRAWRLYDREMQTFPSFVKEDRMQSLSADRAVQNYRWSDFIATYEGHINTWDFQWIYSVLINHGLSICPQVNLVSNIGWSLESTHTFDPKSSLANIPLDEIHEILHPWAIMPDVLADKYFYERHLNIRYHRIKNPIMRWRKMLRKQYKTRKSIKRFIEEDKGNIV
jgi:hypothetical protein